MVIHRLRHYFFILCLASFFQEVGEKNKNEFILFSIILKDSCAWFKDSVGWRKKFLFQNKILFLWTTQYALKRFSFHEPQFHVFYALRRHYFYQVDLSFVRNLLSEEIFIKNCFLDFGNFSCRMAKKSKKIKLLICPFWWFSVEEGSLNKVWKNNGPSTHIHCTWTSIWKKDGKNHKVILYHSTEMNQNQVWRPKLFSMWSSMKRIP
jgi:hypothetical protein